MLVRRKRKLAATECKLVRMQLTQSLPQASMRYNGYRQSAHVFAQALVLFSARWHAQRHRRRYPVLAAAVHGHCCLKAAQRDLQQV